MRYKILLTLMLSNVATHAARAQDVPLTPSAARPPALEQIVVTAKKRQQNAQTVPQTIDVVRASEIQKLNILRFQELQAVVPSLILSDNGGQGQNITLRGVTYDPDTTANPSVDVYVNEVPLSQTSSAFQDIYDLDQVEVIRGPQGTLRGRTSPAGAILLDTKRPDMQHWAGLIEQSVSDDNLFETQLAVGAPIIPDELAIRLAGSFDQNGLYGTKDIVTGQKDQNLQHSGRFTLESRPLDGLDIVLVHQESNDRTRELYGVSGIGQFGAIIPGQNLAVVPGPYTFYDRTGLTTLQTTFDLGNIRLAYIAGYQSIKDELANDQDHGGLLPHFNIGAETLDESIGFLTQELRVQSAGERRLGYMAGVYYAHQDASVHLLTPSETVFAPAPGAAYPGATPLGEIDAAVTIPQLATDYAIFTDESFKLTPNDVFEGGLRWQFERQYRDTSYEAVIPAIFGGGTSTNQLVSPQNQHEEYRAWTGLASYTHHFNKNLMVYTNYGESFRPGGVVLGITLPLPESILLFKPELSYDFEIGAKSEFFGGRLRLNADIYHQAYSNYIGRENNLYVQASPRPASPQPQSITTNGDALARGLEMSAVAQITKNWQFNLNTSFADAHYVNAKLPCNDFAGTGQPNTTGTPRVNGGGVYSVCVTNASLGAPDWYLSLGSEYDIKLTTRVEGFIRGLYTFTPRNQLVLEASNEDPRSILNLYIGARAPSGRWEADIFIKNLFNTVGYSNLFGEQYVTGYSISGAQVNYDSRYASSTILRPREIGATVTYRF